MAEWSKALDLSSSGQLSAWVRTPLLAPIFCGDTLRKNITTPAGFEPARAKPSRFLIYRLNHSATVSKCSSKNLPEGFEPPSSGLEPDVLTTTLWEVNLIGGRARIQSTDVRR